MIRKILSSSLAVLMFSAGSAQADWQTKIDFFKCLKTPLVEVEGTIVDAAVATPELSTLVDLVVAGDLVEALSGPGPLTVYAPTNDAFANLPGPLVEFLTDPANQGALQTVLTYHVSPGMKDPRRAYRPYEISTLVDGQTVFYNYDKDAGQPQINQSTTSCTGVKTSNGIVWVVDKVLLPQF